MRHGVAGNRLARIDVADRVLTSIVSAYHDSSESKMKALFILAIISAIATMVVMFTGAIGMARGTDFNRKYGNKLMQARVALQALTLLLLVLTAATA